MKEGICVAGNAVVDKVYPVRKFPRSGEQTRIDRGVSIATGGAMANVVIDLAKLDPELPLEAVGYIGNDEDGRYIRGQFEKHPNIDLHAFKVMPGETTGYTLVMSDNSTKQRTFFTHCGPNAKIGEATFDWSEIKAGFLHIAHLLLLDALDASDDEYGTKMARLLAGAKRAGLKTSIDVVTDADSRFKVIVPPALRYTDYCVINEVEAEGITGVPLRGENGSLIADNLPGALAALKEMGVSTWAAIHYPEGACGLDERGELARVSSLELPPGYIKGTVGAGDAFCAGAIYAAYKGMSLGEALRIGTVAAACALSEDGSTDGVRTVAEALELEKMFPRAD